MMVWLRNASVVWTRKTSGLFALLGFVYLAVYAIQVVYWDIDSVQVVSEGLSLAIWVLFAVDTVLKMMNAGRISVFLRKNFLEVAALVLPFMRMLRVFRIIFAIRGLKQFFGSRLRTASVYIVLLLPLTWFTGALAILDAEQEKPGASIVNLGDSMWWSLTTITTVGYGDLVPVSLEGKFIAALLLVCGVGLVSACAGVFASWIIGDVERSATSPELKQSEEN